MNICVQLAADLWGSPQLNYLQRKALLRSLISRVIVKRTAADRVEVKIIWASGHFSEGVVLPPVGSQRQVTGYDTMVERTRQLWAEGYSDLQIADILSHEGFRSAQRETVLAKTVMKIRHRHHWVSPYHQHRFADKRDEQWTIRGLARELGVESGWVYNRIRNGFLSESDVRCFSGCAATHVEGTGPAPGALCYAPQEPRVVVTVRSLVLRARM